MCRAAETLMFQGLTCQLETTWLDIQPEDDPQVFCNLGERWQRCNAIPGLELRHAARLPGCTSEADRIRPPSTAD